MVGKLSFVYVFFYIINEFEDFQVDTLRFIYRNNLTLSAIYANSEE